MFKTAILLPRSLEYPLMSIDLFDGCRTLLKHKAIDVDLIIRHAGFGIDEKGIYAEIEKSLLEDQVEVIIAFLDSRYTELLQPIFEATGKILLLVNMGTHSGVNVSARSTVIDHSFQISFSGWLTGMLAAKQGHRRGMMVTSFYDGGYPACFSTFAGYVFEKGEITYNAVISKGNADYDPGIVIQTLEEDKSIDTLLCLLSGTGAKIFYSVLPEIQNKRNIGIYLSPMMIDKSLMNECSELVSHLVAKGYTSWLSSLDNKSNQEFRQIFSKNTGRSPGIFSMLGWETGLLLSHIYNLKNKKGLNGPEIIAELKHNTFDTPRGELRIAEKTNQTYTPVYEVEISPGLPANIKSVFTITEKELENYHSIKPEGLSSGWKNTYLCS